MNREQCYILEIQNLKASAEYLLGLYGLEEDRIRDMFESAHNEAWKKFKEEK